MTPVCSLRTTFSHSSGWAPGLDKSLIGHKLDMATHDVATEKCECATHLPTDFRRAFPQRHAGPHGPTEVHDLVKLSGVGECFIDALAARLEDWLLVDRFSRMGNAILGAGPNSDRACGTANKCNCASDQLSAGQRIGSHRQRILEVHGCIEPQEQNMIKIIF